MASLLFLVLTLFAVSVAGEFNRIVGGRPATIEQYPAMVQVDEFDPFWTQAWSHICAGNIITRRYVLSAAHCFFGNIYDSHYRRIRAGATYRNFGGVIAYIEYAYNHPTYGLNRNDGDISLLRLQTSLVYTPTIQRTTIPPQNEYIPDNLPVVKAGWGLTEQQGSASDILLDVEIYTINNQLCAERYATLPNRSPVTKNMICAGLLDVGGKDGCQGDSGGPLYYTNITIGIISWGEGCANATFPGVNTAVSSYTDWIIANAV